MKAIISIVIVTFVAVVGLVVPAGATHPPHWTDGTTCEGGLCPGGPPPVPAKWSGEACHSDLIVDPNTFVFITVHANENGQEFASEVIPYFGQIPAGVPADSTMLLGHKGTVTLTWNIGLGVSAPMPFDCTVPASTTTSTVISTETTTSTTTATPSRTNLPPEAEVTPPVLTQPKTAG